MSPQLEVNENISVINPYTWDGYDKHIQSASASSIFHSSHWLRALQDSYGYDARCLTVSRNSTQQLVLPFMITNSLFTGRRAISLPFTDFLEPLYAKFDKEIFLNSLVALASQYGWHSFEFRGEGLFFDEAQSSTWYYGHRLNLQAKESNLFASFKSNTRRNIRKAVREGISISLERSIKALRAFYKLNCLTRKRHGLPPQPYRFFANVYKHIISRGMGSIFLAYKGDCVIAAAIFLHTSDHAMYKYGASDYRFQDMRPNNLLMWEAVRYFSERGYKELDFGKTDYGNPGLREYKLGWGTDERIIRYFKYDFGKEQFIHQASRERGWHNRVFRKLPLNMLRVVGAVLYRHAA